VQFFRLKDDNVRVATGFVVAPHEAYASSNKLGAVGNMTCGGYHMVGFTVEKGLIRVAMPHLSL
jgi:hypothetical protein